ncbi:zinc finger protein 592 [Syngnathus typhle]|uniref:zinc finger protein 592 n=1 Tax=Syngnathus typhle TaxID=161592 RepID=UPI002A6A7920|nr:zinc finger protein 592 [Syngnathus typhle]
MGDMKTPDFDDLLAAFDIPDATGLDAKEPIQEGNDEVHLKHSGVTANDNLSHQATPAADVPVVSVIVKNRHLQEPLESFGNGLHSEAALQNGFNRQGSGETANSVFSKSFVSALNGEFPSGFLGEAPIQHKPDATPFFSQSKSRSSPISSPEREDILIRRENVHPKLERSCFPVESDLLEPSAADDPQKANRCIFNEFQKVSPGRSEEPPDGGVGYKMTRALGGLTRPSGNKTFSQATCNLVDDLDPFSQMKPYSSMVPSCFEALVALNARKDPSEQTRDSPTTHSDYTKYSPKVPRSPRSPMSPLEAVKRLMKPPDSPVSICSDSSGKARGSPPVIPKVRIKTIKTTSGQVKRTVTSVPPDSETDDVHSAYESSPSQSLPSEDGACSPKVLHGKSEERPRTPTSFHNLPVKRSAAPQARKPKRTSSAPLPKAAHLASLNLVPHSVAASASARSTSHRSSQRSLSSIVSSAVPLVHQVKTWPPTLVPNTAAGTLNRLLNKANPVPTYVPDLNPPPDSDVRLPARGYRCLECGDSFGVERSLAFHHGRRSVHIEVGCAHCAKTMVFFNKCALLAHARQHKNNGAVMQCTQLHMKPIAEADMFVPLAAETTESRAAPSRSLKNQPVMPLYPDDVTHHHESRCLECDEQMADHRALAGHYQSLADEKKGLFCKLCSMLLPNRCSLEAHQRVHTLKPPYCCPECGAMGLSEDIQKHVRENCLHYARKAWYKCLHCEVVFKTLLGQKSHIEEKHCEVLHKCSVCPVAFKTSDSYDAHLKSKHSASKIPPQFTFKCSCGDIFSKKWLLFQHFHQDANKRLSCVFKCPECNSVFSQKQLLMQHFKSVHGGEARPETEVNSKQTKNSALQHQPSPSRRASVKRTEAPRKKAAQDGKPRAKPSGWTCGECLQCFPERDLYLSHLKSKHGKSLKRYACRQCDQSFSSATSLRRHIRCDHQSKKKTYTCWYCTDRQTTFTSSVMMKNHISLMHGIKNPDLGQMPKSSILACKKDLSKDSDAATSGKEDRVVANSTEAPLSKRVKRHLRCAKCGFVTDDADRFREHIAQHRSAANTPQCLHCGLCFTSSLSLSRHRVIVHKIKDPEEGASDPRTKAEPSETDKDSDLTSGL